MHRSTLFFDPKFTHLFVEDQQYGGSIICVISSIWFLASYYLHVLSSLIFTAFVDISPEETLQRRLEDTIKWDSTTDDELAGQVRIRV